MNRIDEHDDRPAAEGGGTACLVATTWPAAADITDEFRCAQTRDLAIRDRTVGRDHIVTAEGDDPTGDHLMLKFHRIPTSSSRRDERRVDATASDVRPDLRIGNLLDDPGLRRVMGLDETPAAAELPRPEPVPARPFDRRRLLDLASA